MSIRNRILMNDVFLEESEMVRVRDQLPDGMMAGRTLRCVGARMLRHGLSQISHPLPVGCTMVATASEATATRAARCSYA